MDFEKEFKVNEYITLKLEHNRTFIYVVGKRFLQCKRLMINILEKDIPNYDEIDSIDEAADMLRLSLFQNRIVEGPMARPSRIQNETITAEQEFWGHCSNLQTWYEHNYDTRLLHSNLAFPLLKALVNAGDENAKKMLKVEILERLESSHPNVIRSILSAGLLNYFNEEEKKQFLQQNFLIIIEFIGSRYKKYLFPYIYKESLLEYLNTIEKVQLERLNYPILLNYILKMRIPQYILDSFNNKILKHFNHQERTQLIRGTFPVILEYMEKIREYHPNLFLYFFEEKLLRFLDKEEIKNLVQQHYFIILKYIQDIKSPDHLIYIFNTGILDYLNPKDKKQLIHQNYLLIFKNIDLILGPQIIDFPALYPRLLLYIFEERLFDYLSPKEKEQLIRDKFPTLLVCTEEITRRWSIWGFSSFRLTRTRLEEISNQVLVYIYLTVFNAIKGTELITDFISTIVKVLTRHNRISDVVIMVEKKEKETRVFDKNLSNSLFKTGLQDDVLSHSLFQAWMDHKAKKVEIQPLRIQPLRRLPSIEKLKREYPNLIFNTKCKYCLKILPLKSISILIRMKRVYCPYCGNINHKSTFEIKEKLLEIPIKIEKLLEKESQIGNKGIEFTEEQIKLEEYQTKISNQLLQRLRKKQRERYEKLYNRCSDLRNLEYFIVVEKKSGLYLYEHNFSAKEIYATLISRFLMVIQNFKIELFGRKKNFRTFKVEYRKSIIIMVEFVNIQLIVIMKNNPSKDFLPSMEELIYNLYKKLRNRIDYSNEDIILLEDFEVFMVDLINKYLMLPQIYTLRSFAISLMLTEKKGADPKEVCPLCGSYDIKKINDKSKPLYYISAISIKKIYARDVVMNGLSRFKKNLCKRCGYEWTNFNFLRDSQTRKKTSLPPIPRKNKSFPKPPRKSKKWTG